jgi:putative tryptophan/tyrosine transport system substrate-binding protein
MQFGQLKRRQFITLLGGSAATWPMVARAQQPHRMYQIGVLMDISQDDRVGRQYVSSFLDGLRELGWKDSDNIRIDFRWGAADVGRVQSSAIELVNLKPAVILAQGSLAVSALIGATSTIPIVFVQVSDPVGSGIVASLARPGGNITGFTPAEFSMSGKGLEVLKEVAPQVTRIAVIYKPDQAPQLGMLRAIEAAAPSLGVSVSAVSPRDAAEIEHTVEVFGSEPGGGGMIVLANPITTLHRGLIIALMTRHRLPAVYSYSYFVKDGGLVSYGTDLADLYRKGASYVDRILKGAKPADLPVVQPTKFELVINLNTAKALGLTVPGTLLARADEVVE